MGGGSKKFLHFLREGSKSFGGLRRGVKKVWWQKFSIAQAPHQSIYEHSLNRHAFNMPLFKKTKQKRKKAENPTENRKKYLKKKKTTTATTTTTTDFTQWARLKIQLCLYSSSSVSPPLFFYLFYFFFKYLFFVNIRVFAIWGMQTPNTNEKKRKKKEWFQSKKTLNPLHFRYPKV